MQLFGSNTPAIVQYLLAFVIILGVLAVFAAVLRRIGGNRPRSGYAGSSARHRQQRLGVIDAVDIDSHRQLLLLRRDNVEHLVMVGGPNDLLVESGIGRVPYRAPVHAQQPALADEQEPNAGRLDHAGPQAADVAAVAGAAAIASHTGFDSPPSSGVTAPLGPLTPPPLRSLATPVAARTAPAGSDRSTPPGIGRDDAADLAFPPGGAGRAGSTTEPAREPSKGPFSGVARQLEDALKRPFGAVRPAAVTGIDLDKAEGGAAGLKNVTPAAERANTPSAAPVSPATASQPRAEAEGRSASGRSFGTDSYRATPQPGEKSAAPTHEVRQAGVESAVDALTQVPPSRKVPPSFPTPTTGETSAATASAPKAKPAGELPAGETPVVAKPAGAQPIPSPSVAGQSAETSGNAKPADRPARVEAPPVASLETPFAAAPSVAPPTASPVPAAPSGSAPASPRIIGPSDTDGASDTFKVPDALKTSSDSAKEGAAAKEPFDLSSLENIEAEFARLLGRTTPSKDK